MQVSTVICAREWAQLNDSSVCWIKRTCSRCDRALSLSHSIWESPTSDPGIHSFWALTATIILQLAPSIVEHLEAIHGLSPTAFLNAPTNAAPDGHRCSDADHHHNKGHRQTSHRRPPAAAPFSLAPRASGVSSFNVMLRDQLWRCFVESCWFLSRSINDLWF